MTVFDMDVTAEWLLYMMAVAWLLWDGGHAVVATRDQVRDIRQRRHVRRVNDAFADYGIVYRVGQPPA